MGGTARLCQTVSFMAHVILASLCSRPSQFYTDRLFRYELKLMRESRYDSLLKIAKIRVALLLLSPFPAVHQSRVRHGGDAWPIKAARCRWTHGSSPHFRLSACCRWPRLNWGRFHFLLWILLTRMCGRNVCLSSLIK